MNNIKLEWYKVDEKLPLRDAQVLVKAVNPSYNFGWPQLLAGFFIKEFYDIQLNKFRLTGVEGNWTVVEWAYAPE